MSYKKVRTVFINNKKKVLYVKSKGTREYVKSGGEMVLLTNYLRKIERLAAKKAMMAKKTQLLNKRKTTSRGGFFFFDENKGENKEGFMTSAEKEEKPKRNLEIFENDVRKVGMGGSSPATPQDLPQLGGYYNDYSKIGGNPNALLSNFPNLQNAFEDVSKMYKINGGKKKSRNTKKVKAANPLKNLINSLTLRMGKKVKKSKRGGSDEEYNYEY